MSKIKCDHKELNKLLRASPSGEPEGYLVCADCNKVFGLIDIVQIMRREINEIMSEMESRHDER